MPTFFNISNRKGVFMIPSGATKSPTPTPPSFNNTKSLNFDGVDEYVDCGDSNDFSFGNGVTDSPFSVSFWVNLDTIPSAAGFFAKDYDASNREWTVGTFSGPGKIRFLLKNNGGSSQQSIDSTTILSIGQWYHIACTYDGSGGNNSADGLTIYINGTAETPTNIVKQTYTAMANTTAPLTLGMYQLGGTPLGINGNIDEVAIFNSELTSDNINDIYNSGTPTDLTSLSPVAWYRNGDNSTYKLPQILMPENSNKDKVSNYSLNFDGVDDYVNIGNPTELQITGNFTFSAWIKTTASGSTNMIIGKDDNAPNRSYLFYMSSTGELNLTIWRSTVAKTVTSTGTINDGNWHNVIGINDGTNLKLYIDGSIDGSVADGGIVDNTTSLFQIGARNFSPERFFNGTIDEVAVWNSVQDVSSIYNSGTPTTITGATAYWKLGEEATFSTNWTVPDQIGSNDGTSANMTIEDRVGDARNSSNNSVSFNMEAEDINNNVPT